jgi:hypothetical protein
VASGFFAGISQAKPDEIKPMFDHLAPLIGAGTTSVEMHQEHCPEWLGSL